MLSFEQSYAPSRNMKLLLVEPSGSYFNDSCCSEPNSPDSGFSSDDSISSDASFAERLPASTGPLWVPSDDDEEEDVLPALRCTRSKTLPSALRRSRSKQSVKRVRFADSLGLDLENLQYFVKEDLHLQKFNIHFSTPSSSTPPPQLPHFPKQLINQPAPRLVLHNFPYRSEQEYQVKTRDSRVCVAALRASGSSIVGQVNLLNVAFDKVVVVRYTIDGWATQDEIVASYSHRLFDTEDIDAFNFTIAIPVKLSEGKCEFCVQYQVAGAEFWDNNGGDNYIVNVSTKGPSSPFTRCYGASTGLPDAPRGSTRRQQQRRWGRALEESDEETPYVSSAPRRGAHFH